MLLNGTLPSKYFQGGGKRMLSSYLLNIYQASFSAGKIFKMKGQQISSFITMGFFNFFKENDALSSRSMNSYVIFGGQFGIHNSLNCVYLLI